jgi:hypothetical protein
MVATILVWWSKGFIEILSVSVPEQNARASKFWEVVLLSWYPGYVFYPFDV